MCRSQEMSTNPSEYKQLPTDLPLAIYNYLPAKGFQALLNYFPSPWPYAQPGYLILGKNSNNDISLVKTISGLKSNVASG